MKSWSRCLIVLLAGSAILAGCGQNDHDVARVQPQQYQQQQPQYADQSPYGQQAQQPQQYQQPGQQPVIINQAPAAQSSGVGDMIMGGALGYMLGSGNNSRERVVERERVVQAPPPVAQSAPRQQYQQPQAAPKQPTYQGWSKPAATQPVAAKPQTQYGGWSKPATTTSKPSTTPTRSSYSGFSKRR